MRQPRHIVLPASLRRLAARRRAARHALAGRTRKREHRREPVFGMAAGDAAVTA